MNAQIYNFPARDGPRLVHGDGPVSCARREYRFAHMVRLLKLHGTSQRTQIAHLRKLAQQRHLPLPKNPRIFGGVVQDGPNSIGGSSIWCALEVDAWFDAPAARAPSQPSTTPPLPTAVRAGMKQRAAMIAQGRR